MEPMFFFYLTLGAMLFLVISIRKEIDYPASSQPALGSNVSVGNGAAEAK